MNLKFKLKFQTDILLGDTDWYILAKFSL